jgi:hypothetical protein
MIICAHFVLGQAQLEKAKLTSKSSAKGKT